MICVCGQADPDNDFEPEILCAIRHEVSSYRRSNGRCPLRQSPLPWLCPEARGRVSIKVLAKKEGVNAVFHSRDLVRSMRGIADRLQGSG